MIDLNRQVYSWVSVFFFMSIANKLSEKFFLYANLVQTLKLSSCFGFYKLDISIFLTFSIVFQKTALLVNFKKNFQNHFWLFLLALCSYQWRYEISSKLIHSFMLVLNFLFVWHIVGSLVFKKLSRCEFLVTSKCYTFLEFPMCKEQ